MCARRTPHSDRRDTTDRRYKPSLSLKAENAEKRGDGERAIFTTAIGRAVAKRRRSNGSDYKGGRLGGDGGASVWVAKAGTAGRVVGSERG